MSKFTPNQLYEIKQDLWDGMDYKDAMAKYPNLSYQMACGIKAGRMHSSIPWPDGSTGPMSDGRKEELAESRRYSTKTERAVNRALAEPMDVPQLSMKDRASLAETARRAGFSSFQALEDHIRRERVNEQSAKELEAQRIRSAEYDKFMERYDNDPEFRAAHNRPSPHAVKSLPDDQCDPDANEKYSWEDVILLSKAKIVQMAESEDDIALKLAIQICFKLLPASYREEQQMITNAYSLKRKIENFWDANPMSDPRRDYQMLEDMAEPTEKTD